MASLEDLKVGVLVQGILDRSVRVVQVEWHGSDALTLTYTDESGRPGQELLYRDDEARLAVEGQGRAWSMDADGHLFRLVSEARRISLAYLFEGQPSAGALGGPGAAASVEDWVRPGGELGLSSMHTPRPQEVAQGGAGLQHARDRLARDRAPCGGAGGSGGATDAGVRRP